MTMPPADPGRTPTRLPNLDAATYRICAPFGVGPRRPGRPACSAPFHRRCARRRVGRPLTDPAVDPFPQQVRVAAVAGVLRDLGHQGVAQLQRKPSQYVGRITNPRRGRVSLRWTASDSAGSSVTQTVENAYLVR